ncbi:MAG TPA: hypothetical protein VN456_06650, partial [Desulfosporosinus sp.]|nr:hypothetical protein [Desulfosporosinus sp.]
GFFTKSLFLSWSIFALFSSIGAYIVWYARGNGWIAALCGALPIAFLLAEGHSFYYYPAVTQGFDLFFALILFVILPTNKLQHLHLIPFVAFVFIMLLQSHLITIVFGNMWYYVRNILLS